MTSVAIVGAGPAGAALGFLLARRGVDVTLVERQTDFEREFRGEVLMPSGIRAFDQMGLAEPFARLPQARPAALDIHVNGRFVRQVAFPDSVDPTPRIVSQPATLEMLIEQASASPRFRFLRGVTASDLLFEGDRVRGVVVRGNGLEELRADLVVGTDGRGSLVRRRAGLEVERDVEAFDVVWFKIPMPASIEARGRAAQVFLRPAQACLAFPTAEGRLQVGWIIPKGSYGDLRRRGVAEWADEIARQVGSAFGDQLRAHRDALERPFVLDVVCYLLACWHRPGCLLLGDAAHPMSPVGGQGLNIALRDALVAANHLVPACADGSPAALDAAAAAIQRERMPEVREVERLQRIPPRFFFGRRWLVRVGLALLPALLRSGLIGRNPRLPAITRTFLDGVCDVELRV